MDGSPEPPPINNEPQFAAATAARSVAENTEGGESIGDPVNATDTDGDTLTGSDAFTIDDFGRIAVASGADLDYETQAQHTVTVTVHDGKNAAGEADSSVDDSIEVTITVLNVDEPGVVSLDSDTPQAGAALTATVLDPDGVVEGSVAWQWKRSPDGTTAGNVDLTNFNDIEGGTGSSLLLTNADDAGRWLRAKATYADAFGAGKGARAQTANPVQAAEPPSITAGPILNSPANGDTYGAGEEIVVALTFSEAVTVRGEPRLRLTIGDQRRWAGYDQTSEDGATLSFVYAVKTEDRDDDGISIRKNALALNNGGIADGDGNAANLAHPAVPDLATHKVNGSAIPALPQSASTGVTVAWNWPLIPSGYGPGDKFRLLFVTSGTRDTSSSDIGDYNRFVQGQAAKNNNLAGFSSLFRVVGSTSAVHACANTETRHESSGNCGPADPSVAIFWVEGARVADNYGDFYDGSWDSYAGRHESGSVFLSDPTTQDHAIFTGTENDGTLVVRPGEGGCCALGNAKASFGQLRAGKVLDSGFLFGDNTIVRPFYAISPVITVGNPTVSADWAYVPDGVNPGDSFRLLFVTSSTHSAQSADIWDYINVVRGKANDNEVLKPYKEHFRVLASTQAQPARGVTGTTYTDSDKGSPIYWVNGARVADDYADFYDSSWDSHTATDESGSTVGTVGRIWTGSNRDGTIDAGNYLNAAQPAYGQLQTGQELNSGQSAASNQTYRLYGMSPVLTVENVVPADWAYVPAGLEVGDSFRLLFITSTKHMATSTSEQDYIGVVKGLVGTNEILRPYKSGFRALASTQHHHARGLTDTAPINDSSHTSGEGLPIYWVNGVRVANDYQDFYDGNWDSRAATNESGNTYADVGNVRIWTGSNSNGTIDEGNYLGADKVTAGEMALGNEINSGTAFNKSESRNLYGMSPALTIGPSSVSTKPLAKPAGLMAEAGDAQVKLTWTDPSNDDITKYRYRYRKSADPDWGSWTSITGSGASTTTVTITGLDNGDEYDFQIRAVAGNKKAASKTIKATPAATTTTAPAKPAGLTAEAGNGQVTLSWTDPSNTAITGYAYRYRKTGATNWGSWTSITGSGASTTTVTITGLDNGDEYDFQIRALVGNKRAASDIIKATPAITTPSGQYTCPKPSTVTAALPTAAQALALTDDTAEEDCNILLSAQSALEGTATTALNWAYATPVQSWDGVNLDESNRAVYINVNERSPKLAGTIPAQLGSLSALTSLDLGANTLTGAVPTQLGSLSALTFLALGSNALTSTIPEELGSLSALTYLALDGNALSGTIPAKLADLSSLLELRLCENNLTGNIPAALGGMSVLHDLCLGGNQLDGAIPAQLGGMTALKQLGLSRNDLGGPIPAALGSLTSLMSLSLFDNDLTGGIPSELGDLTELRWLWLHDNELSGCIPGGLADLANLSKFHGLGLHDNNLAGLIPSGLDTVFTGTLPTYGAVGVDPRRAVSSASAAAFATRLGLAWATTGQESACVEVPSGSNLVPAGVSVGDSLRLLFIGSTKRNATATDIATYNGFVQGLAANKFRPGGRRRQQLQQQVPRRRIHVRRQCPGQQFHRPRRDRLRHHGRGHSHLLAERREGRRRLRGFLRRRLGQSRCDERVGKRVRRSEQRAYLDRLE